MRLRLRAARTATAVGITLAVVSRAARSAAPPAHAPIAILETQFLDFRDLKDLIDVTVARGAPRSEDGVDLSSLATRYRVGLGALRTRLATAATPNDEGDQRALEVMRRALAEAPADPLAEASDPSGAVECGYDPQRLLDSGSAASVERAEAALRERAYACFGQAARTVVVGEETLDRLTVLSRLGQSDDPDERRRLFLALGPVWQTMNRDNGPASPYRVLARRNAERWRGPESPPALKARELGISPETLERWLVQVLEDWRDATPEALEPWDYWHATERASRALNPQVPRERLRELNDRFYQRLGADPERLGVHYDVEPRPGKTPVAFTTFGERRRLRGGAWTRGQAWIFATYRSGGLGNLVELLHETGHAIHIAAIETRPAFADWPDSDVYTEALGDLVALEAYEPEWQQEYLGRTAPVADGIRAKYAGIVMDVAWGLFEWRVHRDPQADPNQVWTDLTHEYLRLKPHPELSWWAMRGQLLNSPGYMMNYAAGAFLAADLRARCRELRGPFSRPDPGYYPWLAERLFRFGLERPSRQVVEDFLGRPLQPDALLADLRRAQVSPSP